MHGPSSSQLTDTPLTRDLVHGELELEPGPEACSRTGCRPGPAEPDGQLVMT